MVVLHLTDIEASMLLEAAENLKGADQDCFDSEGECNATRYIINDETPKRWKGIIDQLTKGAKNAGLDSNTSEGRTLEDIPKGN